MTKTYIPLSVTVEQRANLETLYAYLATVDEEHFDMGSFMKPFYFADDDTDTFSHNGQLIWVAKHIKAGTFHTCNSIACMVGNGPAAGILSIGNEDWFQYARRAFGADDRPGYDAAPESYEASPQNNLWNWAFAGEWDEIDNTPEGGRRRLRLALDKGIPSDYDEQMSGEGLYECAPDFEAAI